MLCECGCGNPTSPAVQTDRRRGWIQGQPLRFVHNHRLKGERIPLIERFWPKVNRNGPMWNGTPCWLWIGAIKDQGYGNFKDSSGKTRTAHCVSYEQLVGPIPTGLELDHLCRVLNCVNPGHLEPVTKTENCLRGVSFAAINARKTHCNHGHEFNEANTYIGPNKDRACKACHSRISRNRRARIKAQALGLVEKQDAV